MRRTRKQEHIENYLRTSYKTSTLFENIYIEHSAISDRNLDEIDTSMEFLGKKISFPFMINAITGGSNFAQEINESLAKIAKEVNIPIAVGSQKIALEDESAIKSFKIVRDINKDGVVIANLGALSSLEEAVEAIEMIDADALQLHLNLAQELVMSEGDREFKGTSKNIKNLAKNIDKPIIVKEVGSGINGKTAKKLYGLGVRYIDLAGKGGSNFVEIEDLRDASNDFSELYEWGVPTALALLEAKDLKKEDLFIIASGGVRESSEIAKSIILGAKLCAGSGEIINYLLRGGYDVALEYVKNLKKKLQIYMLLLNVGNVEELSKVNYKIFGRLKELYS